MYNSSMKTKLALVLTLSLLALPALCKDFSIQQVIGRAPRQVDAAIGKPLSIGEGGTFREYGTKRSAWYVRFAKSKATVATVKFRTAFPTPEAALQAIGLNLRKAKPIKTTFLLRRWANLRGMSVITVSSLDGKRWDTVEVEK